MDDRITPIELARELGHEPEARPGLKVRRYLRKHYPRPEAEKNTRWLITPEQAAAIRLHFRGDED